MKTRIATLALAILMVFMVTMFPVNVSPTTESPTITIGSNQWTITIGPQEVSAVGLTDYSCDGVADDVQFQAALNALPATGGKLVVLGGTYNFTALTTVTRAIANVTIEGVGRATYFTCDAATAVFTAGGNNWIFRNLRTDAGGLDMGATTGWEWENVTINATHYAYRTEASVTAEQWVIPTGRGAALTVAAANATAIEKAQADYVCDGTNDQTEINVAIAAAKYVVLSTGTFTVAPDTLNIATANACLLGQGVNTVIKAATGGYIVQLAQNDVSLSNLAIDGDGAQFTHILNIQAFARITVSRVYIYDADLVNGGAAIFSSGGTYCTVRDVEIKDISCVAGAGDNNGHCISYDAITDGIISGVRSYNAGGIGVSGASERVNISDAVVDVASPSVTNNHAGLYVLETASFVNITNVIVRRRSNQSHGGFELRGQNINVVNCHADGFDTGIELQSANDVDAEKINIVNCTATNVDYGVHAYRVSGTTGMVLDVNITSCDFSDAVTAAFLQDEGEAYDIKTSKVGGVYSSSEIIDSYQGRITYIVYADGVINNVNSGSSSPSVAIYVSSTGVVANSSTRNRTTVYNLGNQAQVDWDKEFKFITNFNRLNSDTEAKAWLQVTSLGDVTGAITGPGYGLQMDNLALTGESYGAARSTVALGFSVTDGIPYTLTIHHIPGVRGDFYINGVLLGSITTAANLPSGSQDIRFTQSITNGATGGVDAKLLRLSPAICWSRS